jgi:hypothetical protein
MKDERAIGGFVRGLFIRGLFIRHPFQLDSHGCFVRVVRDSYLGQSGGPRRLLERECRAWVNRSYPEGKWLLLRISTESLTLRAFSPRLQRRRKAGQREHSDREDYQAQARPGKTFQKVGDVTNDAADL